MEEKTKEEKISELVYFTGTEQYYKGWLGVKWTDGVYYVYLDIAGWLITDICSYMVEEKIKNISFQVWTIKVDDDKAAVLTMTDGNENEYARQEYTHVDLPAGTELKFYIIDNIMLLPSEY